MGTRKTQLTLYGVPIFISEDHLGAFFSDYGPVKGVSSIKSKMGIATSDYEMVTLTLPKFNEVPNIIICGGQNIYVVVEGQHSSC